MSQHVLLIGDRAGLVQHEITAEIGPMSWRLNEIGQVPIFLSTTNQRLDPDVLKKGNRVAIVFDNGLVWGGVVAFPVTWSLDGAEVTLKGAGQLLKHRVSADTRQFSAATAGDIVSGLIADLNGSAYPLNFDIGDIDTTGDTFTPTFNRVNVWDSIRAVTREWTNKDHFIQTTVRQGQINFIFNLYAQRGSDKPNIEWSQGHNLVNLDLVQQGPPINFWHVIGGGSVWDQRVKVQALDNASIETNGITEAVRVESSITDQTELQQIADNLVAQTANLVNIYTVQVLDKSPADFYKWDIGDIGRLYAPGFLFGGLDQAVRVVAKEHDPNVGVMDLAVEDWTT